MKILRALLVTALLTIGVAGVAGSWNHVSATADGSGATTSGTTVDPGTGSGTRA
jgi:hypothetical protein